MRTMWLPAAVRLGTMRRMIRSSTVCALLLACSLVPARAARDPADTAWVGTWGASPSEPLPGQTPAPPSFENQTVRLIVRVSLGGSTVRLRLSNALGAAALRVGTVHVARWENGAVVAGTDREVGFYGQLGTVIPRGAPVLSDPVSLSVPDGSDLAVSLFFPVATGPVTEHALAVQTGFVAHGNVAADPVLAGATPITTRPVLAGVEVERHEAVTVVALGDSITDGARSTVDADARYPDALARRLLAAKMPVGVVNEGISGNRLLSEAAAGPNALARFDRDVLGQVGVRSVIVLLGINDIGRAPDAPVTARDVIAALQQIAARGHDRGLRMVGGTLLPFEGAGYATAEGEAMRMAVNEFIRNSGAFDAVVDFDAAVRDPGHPARLRAEFDSGDHLHPNDAGYAAMAEAVDLKLLGP